MKLLVSFVPLMFATYALAQDLTTLRRHVEGQIASLPVVAHFDQPYAGTDNPKQMLDLYLPKNHDSGKALPVIVFVHGGSWNSGDRIKAAQTVLRFPASQNYAAVTVSYRLTTEARWPAQIHDTKAAIRWIRGNAEKFGLDHERIGVWGTSAGGYLVSLLGTSQGHVELDGNIGPFTSLSTKVSCVINQCGPQDFTMPLMYHQGNPVVEDWAVVNLLGHSLADNQEKARAASPVTYVSSDDPPFFTLHGTKDERVDFKHAERIHSALQAAGVASWLLPVIDGGHGFNNPQLEDRISRFFDHYLRDQTVEIISDALPNMKVVK